MENVPVGFFKFNLAKHKILTLKANTILSYVKLALQKMTLSEGSTYKVHKDVCASNNYYQKGCVGVWGVGVVNNPLLIY
jgi:hypothetical protein